MKCRREDAGPRTKQCEVCNTEFTVSNARAKTARFCSMECKGVAFRVTFDCEVCGVNTYGFTNRNKRFCSRECAGLGRRTKVERSCAICGTSFFASKYQADRGQGRFCSNACHNLHQGRNKSDHVCKMCGDSFRWSPSRTAGGNYNIKYCSIQCRNDDPEHRVMLLEIQAAQSRANMNKFEARGYALLDEIGEPYIAQAPFAGKFVPDAAIPGARLVVQFDGDYWHDRAGTSTEPRIIRRVTYDRTQDNYIRSCGWDVVRLWESELRDAPEMCRERIIQAIRRPLGAEPERDPLARA